MSINEYSEQQLMTQFMDISYEELLRRVERVLEHLMQSGQIEGNHHRAWAIDQTVRILLGDQYERFIISHNMGGDGIDTYIWDEGIAP